MERCEQGVGMMGQLLGVMTWFAILVGSAAAWFTHIYQCFTEEQWGFLIAGALFFPIAIVHGVGIWFGVW